MLSNAPGHGLDAFPAIAMPDGSVIGGGQGDDKKSTPLLWTSDDGGRTVAAVQLPPVNGMVGPMAASASTIVAVEQWAEDNGVGTWRSTDGGRSWQLTKLATGDVKPLIKRLLQTARGWLMVGTGLDSNLFLASSSDGIAWHVLDTSKLSAREVSDATVAKSDDVVIIGEAPTDGSQFGCGAAWIGAADSLRRVDLGCDEQPRATAALADGRVIVVGTSSVWVRA
ncbi:hypothetical protein [Kutzneria sp. 744]|uniref:hypothetical protein n=1 Tax=Kutzneria sp. (strain 744) TaxID=345341 RepID=UPI0003EEADAA|nr:hypothetical protein [Kutzneria sp. 744]EWM14497.1 hypothetical protein KUTG_04801 [Kutzneria sp. 744]